MVASSELFTTEDGTPLLLDPEPTPLKVVTTFVWDGERVLLMLRGDTAPTYPGHWSGVSGVLENETPLERAFIEVTEETGIARDQITVGNVGEPIEIYDEVEGLSFLVHPFLFRVPPGVSAVEPTESEAGGLVLSDENQACEWVPVEDFELDFERLTVPGLHDAFDMVWPAWKPARAIEMNLRFALEWLRADRELGAGSLARAAARAFEKLVALVPRGEYQAFKPLLLSGLTALRDVRPAMAPAVNMMSDLLDDFRRIEDAKALIQTIERHVKAAEWAEAEVAKQAARFVTVAVVRAARPEVVLTHSYSGTVLRSLVAMGDKLARVYVCEARPMLEGRRLATRLAEEDIPVTLITEAQVFLLMPEIDRVILGADAVLADGTAINKVGSRQIAVAAREFNKPVLLLASTHKFRREAGPEAIGINGTATADGVYGPVPPSVSGAGGAPVDHAYHASVSGQSGAAGAMGQWGPAAHPVELNPREEVWDRAPDGVEVRNIYYEAVPAPLITHTVTEHGLK
jgi:ribose 1,5-bisphosphate isomerase